MPLCPQIYLGWASRAGPYIYRLKACRIYNIAVYKLLYPMAQIRLVNAEWFCGDECTDAPRMRRFSNQPICETAETRLGTRPRQSRLRAVATAAHGHGRERRAERQGNAKVPGPLRCMQAQAMRRASAQRRVHKLSIEIQYVVVPNAQHI